MSDYYDHLETRDPEQRLQSQFECLQQQLRHAREQTIAYKALNIEPVKDFASFAHLPITRKSTLLGQQKEIPPLGGYVAASANLANIFSSPGPIYEPGSERSDFWRFARSLYAAGFREADLIHNCFSYHFTPAGAMVESGARALKCTVIPAGVGQTELQVQTINDLKPQAYVGTPSFLKIILDKANELGGDVTSLQKALVGGEALPPSLRAGFVERGLRVQQCYATADLGMIAYESSAQDGLIIDEGVYVEIVKPGSGDPVADGDVGEVVVTNLNPDYPLIRFATGDLSAMMQGCSPCGRTNKRIKGWMGRADQTVKVRGMFVRPEQVDRVIKRHPEIIRARLVIEWQDDADQLKFRCESRERNESLISAIADSVRGICKLRADVELTDENSLPNDGKVIDDIRQYDSDNSAY